MNAINPQKAFPPCILARQTYIRKPLYFIPATLPTMRMNPLLRCLSLCGLFVLLLAQAQAPFSPWKSPDALSAELDLRPELPLQLA